MHAFSSSVELTPTGCGGAALTGCPQTLPFQAHVSCSRINGNDGVTVVLPEPHRGEPLNYSDPNQVTLLNQRSWSTLSS